MGGVTRILLGKDKRNGFDWYTLIYDSFHFIGNSVVCRIGLLPSLGNIVACLAIMLSRLRNGVAFLIQIVAIN